MVRTRKGESVGREMEDRMGGGGEGGKERASWWVCCRELFGSTERW